MCVLSKENLSIFSVVEYDETYCSLARFAILTLCNATLSADSVLKGAACEAAIQSGAFHTIWSVLLCSGAVLKASLAVSNTTLDE